MNSTLLEILGFFGRELKLVRIKAFMPGWLYYGRPIGEESYFRFEQQVILLERQVRTAPCKFCVVCLRIGLEALFFRAIFGFSVVFLQARVK